MSRLYYRSDFEKVCLLNTFEYRGWIREEDDWNIYWANKESIRQIFNPENGYRLQDDQILNHFPNYYQLTRKDLMVKNIKRYTKDRQKLYMSSAAQRRPASRGPPSRRRRAANSNTTRRNPISSSSRPPSRGRGDVAAVGTSLHTGTSDVPPDRGVIRILDFVPMTYILPGDYSIFVEEFRRAGSHTRWIVKPIAKSRGIGVFIVTRLSQVKRWSRENRPFISAREQHVVSKYVDRPLLIGGKKFDLRLYCLVTSYRPLKCYFFSQGFCRFCQHNYTNDSRSLENMFIHLTNVAIQKHGRFYNEKHGGKFSFHNLLFWIESTRGKAAADKLLAEIHYIMIMSLKSCQAVVVNDKHCFEVYGFDILLDETLQPWLLEINASPSLTSTTVADRILKTQLIRDTFNIVVRDEFPEVSYKDYKYEDDRGRDLGDYQVLYDEYNQFYGNLPNSVVNGEEVPSVAPTRVRRRSHQHERTRRAFK